MNSKVIREKMLKKQDVHTVSIDNKLLFTKAKRYLYYGEIQGPPFNQMTKLTTKREKLASCAHMTLPMLCQNYLI